MRYLDENVINNDNTVNIIKILEIENFKLLRELLEKIKEYEESLRIDILSKINTLEENSIIEQYLELLKDNDI